MIKKLVTALFLASAAFAGDAFATDYVIDGAASKVTFKATQNGAPFNGAFSDIDGNVSFDPHMPQNAVADVRVKTSSVTADGDEIVSTLLSQEWLGVQNFPQARFTLTNLSPAANGGYAMQGELDVKGNVTQIDAAVTVEEQTDEKLVATAVFDFDRIKFGVGWGDTSSASATALVTAHIVANAKK